MDQVLKIKGLIQVKRGKLDSEVPVCRGAVPGGGSNISNIFIYHFLKEPLEVCMCHLENDVVVGVKRFLQNGNHLLQAGTANRLPTFVGGLQKFTGYIGATGGIKGEHPPSPSK